MGMKRSWSLGLLLLLGLAGGMGAQSKQGTPNADPWVAAKDEVRAAEIAFAGSVSGKDRAQFASMIAEDAVFLGGGGASHGRAEIVAGWEPFFASGAPDFLWHPESVEISGDGTLGLTRGPWTMKGVGPDGTSIDRKGTFTSIWRKQGDGSWLVTFDAGCPECPSCGG